MQMGAFRGHVEMLLTTVGGFCSSSGMRVRLPKHKLHRLLELVSATVGRVAYSCSRNWRDL